MEFGGKHRWKKGRDEFREEASEEARNGVHAALNDPKYALA